MAEITLKIEGMTCQHCVVNVKKAIDGIAGVKSSEVSMGRAKVVYDDPQTSTEEIEKSIQTAGYKVTDQG